MSAASDPDDPVTVVSPEVFESLLASLDEPDEPNLVLAGAAERLREMRAPSDFCQWRGYAGYVVGGKCPECGHAVVVHIGVEHCPVCELVYQASPRFRRQQMRLAGMPVKDMW